MPNAARRRPLVLAAAFVALGSFSLALSAAAQDAFDLSVPKEREEGAAPAVALECAAESISGSGPGFSSNRDDSEAAAVEAWLKKAKAIYPEATWETAKDSDVACAVQGLYSKCFADGIPCKPKG